MYTEKGACIFVRRTGEKDKVGSGVYGGRCMHIFVRWTGGEE